MHKDKPDSVTDIYIILGDRSWLNDSIGEACAIAHLRRERGMSLEQATTYMTELMQRWIDEWACTQSKPI